MVSSGTVSADSSELSQVSNNYMSQLEGLSSSWKGSSHDNLVSRGSEFNSEMQKVTSQMNSFANAASLYEKYKELKDKARSSTDAAYKSECESRMAEYASQIKSALSEASSFKLEARSITASASDTAAEDTSTDTTTTTTTTIGSGGQFVADSSYGVYGHIQSSIDGLTHTIFRQSQIEGWARDCNRAAAASIASAYGGANQAVSVAKKSAGGIGYNQSVTNKYFNQFGLSANVTHVNGSYDSIKNDIVSNLSKGNYVMFDLSQPNVKGKSGQKWTSTRHWVSILDIKKTGNGPNDYAIFVSDSGHSGSTKDHGLGAGWYSLDEFSGKKIANFTTISNTQRKV